MVDEEVAAKEERDAENGETTLPIKLMKDKDLVIHV